MNPAEQTQLTIVAIVTVSTIACIVGIPQLYAMWKKRNNKTPLYDKAVRA